jgi:parallel beta-helix repeat protein
MGNIRRFVLTGLVGGLLLISAGEVLHAEDISGTIVRTLILSETTRLVGDVTCRVEGAPCIAFGAPGIALYLNGFTITGLTDPVIGCNGGLRVANEFGISTNGQSNVEVIGPGVVQRFRNTGIIFIGTIGGQVKGVTATTNCGSGIQVNAPSSGIRVEANVCVRNGSPVGQCGGICIVASNNVIQWNETSGNGYADPADDYGIGIVSGNNNRVEANTAIGNTNGIILFPASTNNVVRGNVVVGNPPIQLSVSLPGISGVDIRNLSAPGTSNFDRNVCVTAVNAPCPDLSTSAIPRKPQN